MKCSVKQYMSYLCRVINQENRTAARALTEQLTYAHPKSTGLPRGAYYDGQRKARPAPSDRPT